MKTTIKHSVTLCFLFLLLGCYNLNGQMNKSVQSIASKHPQYLTQELAVYNNQMQQSLHGVINQLTRVVQDTLLKDKSTVKELIERLEGVNENVSLEGIFLIIRSINMNVYLIHILFNNWPVFYYIGKGYGSDLLDASFRLASSLVGSPPLILVSCGFYGGIEFDPYYPSIIAVGGWIAANYFKQGFVFRNHNPITLICCSISKCKGNKGGAIEIENANVNIICNTISMNRADICGGGIYSSCSPGYQALIIANEISNNSAPSGGGMALVSDTTSIAIFNSVRHNTAVDRGGGVYMDGCSLSLLGANKIYSNSVTNGSGGGIGLENCGGIIVAGNSINSNNASCNGGGIACIGDTNQIHIPVLLSCNNLSDNQAANFGGGISVRDDQEAQIIGNNIHINAADSGGGIFLHSSNLLTWVTGNQIVSNTALKGGGLFGFNTISLLFANHITLNSADDYGGGVVWKRSAGWLYNNSLKNNISVFGAGIYLNGNKNPYLYDNYLSGNNAFLGGGIFITEGNDAKFAGNVFSGNHADDRGGAIYVTGNGTRPLIESLNFFVNNTADRGGAIAYDQYSELSINENVFKYNMAGEGGAILVQGSNSLITNNEFTGNKAFSNGGAIFTDPGYSVNISNNLFKRNIAGFSLLPFPAPTDFTGARGGALFGSGPWSMLNFHHNQFIQNLSMQSDGGAVALFNVDGNFTSNQYVSNLAAYEGVNGSGGAVYSNNCRINFSNESFLWNVASHGGGIACVGGSLDTLRNCIFRYNIADKDSLSTGEGGAILVTENNTCVFAGEPNQGNEFTNNYAANGGAISVSSGSLVAMDNLFTSNRAAYFTGSGSGGAVHGVGITASLDIGGNAALDEGNVFNLNTAGRSFLPDSAHGGAISLTEGAHAVVNGNTFNNHNASSGKGGAAYFTDTGTFCQFGDYNEGPINEYPFTSIQFGNIVQNNNNSLLDSITFPVIPWPVEIDTLIDDPLPDTLVIPPQWPDSSTQQITLTDLSNGIPLCVLPDMDNLPNKFIYAYEAFVGIKVVDATNPYAMLTIDSIPLNEGISGYDAGNYRLVVLTERGKLQVYRTFLLPVNQQLVFESEITLPDSLFGNISLGGDIAYLTRDNVIYALNLDDTIHQLLPVYSISSPDSCNFSFLKNTGTRMYAVFDLDSTSQLQVFTCTPFSFELENTFDIPLSRDIFELNDTLYITYCTNISGSKVWGIKVIDCTNPQLITEIAGLSSYTSGNDFYSVFADHKKIYISGNNEITVILKNIPFILAVPQEIQLIDLDAHEQSEHLFGASPRCGVISLEKNLLMVCDSLSPSPLNELFSFPWPSFIPYLPNSSWIPEIPIIPDTLILQQDTGQRSTLLSTNSEYDVINPVYQHSMPDSIITLDGGFMAIVNFANAVVLGNLIGGERLENANTAKRAGGGVFINRAGNLLQIGDTSNMEHDRANFIQGNVAFYGGGICIKDHHADTVEIINNWIGGLTRHSGNHSGTEGGGIWADSSSFRVYYNYIMNNSCGFDSVKEFNPRLPGHGGGIHAYGPLLMDIGFNWIINNLSFGNAGGIGIGGPCFPNFTHIIHHNTITENHALDENRYEQMDDTISWMINDSIPRPIGTDLFLNLHDTCVLSHQPFHVYNNLIDHIGILDSYAFAADSFSIDTILVNAYDNNIWCHAGKKYGGLDLTGINGNVSIPPQYVSPFTGNYSQVEGSSLAYFGWNPSSMASGILTDTLRVPGDYLSITAAMSAASYGDIILVDTLYHSANDNFPILVKDGVILSSTAFASDRPDINLIRKVILNGNDCNNLLMMNHTGPRTMIRGFTFQNSDTAVAALYSGGRIYNNVFIDNHHDIVVHLDSSVSIGWQPLFIDHNTITHTAVITFDRPETLPENIQTRLAEGPCMSNNIFNNIATNIDSIFPDTDSIVPNPWINLEMAYNSGKISGYYKKISWPNAGIDTIYPDYIDSSNRDYRLKDSSLLISFRHSTRFIGALYVKLQAEINVADSLGFKPFIYYFSDSSDFHPGDSLYYYWNLSTGDSSFERNPHFLVDSAGLFNISLLIRDPYQTDRVVKNGIIRCLQPGGAIHGFVLYDNTDTFQLLDSVIVVINDTLTGFSDTIQTSVASDYWISGLAGGEYQIHAIPLIAPGGINTIDALLTQRHYVSLDTLTALRLKAADVNATGFINSIDALLILRYFVELINDFPAGPWQSENNTTTIPPNCNSITVVITKVISTGDVDASFKP